MRAAAASKSSPATMDQGLPTWNLPCGTVTRRAGDWDYFESRVDRYQTIERVHTGLSPLLRPPLWKERRDPMMEARRIELAHRGHATAVAAAALACVVSG